MIIELKQEAGRVRLTLLDNGCGFDCTGAEAGGAGKAGFGLANIAATKMIGGELQIQSAPGRGTALTRAGAGQRKNCHEH